MSQKRKLRPVPPETITRNDNHIPAPASSREDPTLLNSKPFDFNSPEFNVRDDLDDNIDNYRHFENLDDIVTADMRHQMERKKRKSDRSRNKTGADKEEKERVADSGVPESHFDTSPLTIRSRGRTLIIDTDPERADNCLRLLEEQGVQCTVCLAVPEIPDKTKKHRKDFLQTEKVMVSGGFGGFKVLFADDRGQFQPLRLNEHNTASFDLVLDLQEKPGFTGRMLPLGYYAPGNDIARLNLILDELPMMRGMFNKPRFIIYRQEDCLYGRSRTEGCRHCLESCPVGAVREEKGKLAFDPYICQGCGCCGLVCPAEAVSMTNPSREELLAEVRAKVAECLEVTEVSPHLVIHDSEMRPEVISDDTVLEANATIFLEVEETGRIGVETMLAALAYGAGRVVLVCNPDTPLPLRQALEQQRQIGIAVLQGLNLPTESIELIFPAPGREVMNLTMLRPSADGTGAVMPPVPPAGFSPLNSRRVLTRLAAVHLHSLTADNPETVPLPDFAPYGTVQLDATACTLCMACAAACPTGALAAAGDLPRLSFSEDRCHQCGLCREACPEAALSLKPRLLCSGGVDLSPVVLKESEPFTCVECGVPFASPAMIARLQSKLAGHWMYSSDRQQRRLRMCRTCRTRDALLAKDFRQ